MVALAKRSLWFLFDHPPEAGCGHCYGEPSRSRHHEECWGPYSSPLMGVSTSAFGPVLIEFAFDVFVGAHRQAVGSDMFGPMGGPWLDQDGAPKVRDRAGHKGNSCFSLCWFHSGESAHDFLRGHRPCGSSMVVSRIVNFLRARKALPESAGSCERHMWAC